MVPLIFYLVLKYFSHILSLILGRLEHAKAKQLGTWAPCVTKHMSCT